jgi:hypothetical protein
VAPLSSGQNNSDAETNATNIKVQLSRINFIFSF